MERRLIKLVNTQQLQSSVQGAGKAQLLVEDGHDQVNRHRNPDLRLHGVGTGAKKMFDAQVTFDPAEEEFDLSTQTVDLGDDHGGDVEMVGQEDQIATGFGVEVTPFAKRPGKNLARGCKRRFANLVAAHSARRVHCLRTLAGETQVVFGTRDEKLQRRRCAPSAQSRCIRDP